jgi:S-adenosylmethionine decarboxylase
MVIMPACLAGHRSSILLRVATIEKEIMYWGYHLMLDCSECDLESMTDRFNIYNFVKVLIKRIDMVAHGEPVIEFLCPGDTDKEGYSLMQLITTSNITAHFIDHHKHIYLDVFSCKEFDVKVVEQTVQEFFGARNIRMNFITRQAG